LSRTEITKLLSRRSWVQSQHLSGIGSAGGIRHLGRSRRVLQRDRRTASKRGGLRFGI